MTAYECDVCGRYFTTTDGLERHITEEHQIPLDAFGWPGDSE